MDQFSYLELGPPDKIPEIRHGFSDFRDAFAQGQVRTKVASKFLDSREIPFEKENRLERYRYSVKSQLV